MKQISIFIGLVLISLAANSQQVVEKSASTEGIKNLVVESAFADEIIVMQGNSGEVKAWAEYRIDGKVEKDAFILEFVKEGNTLVCRATFEEFKDVEVDFKDKGDHPDVDVKSGKHKHSSDDKDYHIEMDITLKLWIPSDLALEISTISGGITVTATNLPLELQSISGDVDITLPLSTNAQLECHSISGKVYADPEFNISLEKDEDARFLPFANIEATMNEGGEEIELNTISGNIFIRKK